MPSRRRSVLVVAFAAAAVLAGTAGATVFSNAASITITDASTATPYPSNITASGVSGSLTSITATITTFSHTSTDDVDVLLVGPNNKTVVLMADAGGFNNASNLTITFSDAAGSSLPDTTPLSSGTFKPSNYGPSPGCTEPNPDSWPAPAPAGPYGSTMASMLGSLANGVYKLYIVDDCNGDAGSIQGGWSINITGGGPTAVSLRSFGAVPSKRQVVLRWRTASETSLLGFNVYRVAGKHAVRLNRALIPAKAAATIADGSYRLVDRSVRPGAAYTYRLQSVALSGTRSWIGSAGVRIAF